MNLISLVTSWNVLEPVHSSALKILKFYDVEYLLANLIEIKRESSKNDNVWQILFFIIHFNSVIVI